MAQKLVLINGVVNGDALNHEPLKGIIEDGYEVASISGFVTQDNNPMCLVLLDEVEEEVEPVGAPSFGLTQVDESATLTMSSATDGASIYYTTNGNTPTSSSTAYSSGVTLSATTTIKAIAIKDGVTSEVSTFTYTVPVESAET